MRFTHTNKRRMNYFRVDEFIRMLKFVTLLHHHGAIDRIVEEFRHTLDCDMFARKLINEVGMRRIVLESAYSAGVRENQCPL